MEYSFYTKEESARIKHLMSVIDECNYRINNEPKKKMIVSACMTSKISDSSNNTDSFIDSDIKSNLHKSYIDRINEAKSEHSVIYKNAEQRYVDFVLANNGEDFLQLVKERISVYTDYVGISFLNSIMSSNHDPLYFFKLRSEIESLIVDIYLKQAGDNHQLTSIFSQVQQIIIEKSNHIYDCYNDLLEKGKLDIYLNEYNQLDGQQSFLTAQLLTPTQQEENKNQIRNVKKCREKAEEMGALMTLGKRLATPSDKSLEHAFNAFSIYNLPGTAEDFNFDESGKLDIFSLDGKSLESQNEIYTAFLGAMFQLVCTSDADINTDNNITFYVTRVYDELGLKTRETTFTHENGKNKIERSKIPAHEMRFNNLLNILKPIEKLVGKLPDGSYYRVLTFSKYDAESDTMTLNSPYLYKVKEIAMKIQDNKNRSTLNRLLHSDVAKERNRDAVELANRIIVGLLRRGVGNKKNGIVEWKVKYITLIEDCPQFAKDLHEIERNSEKNKTQRYNSKLRNTFNTAFKIIEEKSDAPRYYLDFKIEKICPTKSMLRNSLVITHKGKNEDYESPFYL